MAEGDLQRLFGSNLRQWRTVRGLSQEDLADLLGYHRTYVGGIERGERNLSLRSVERIAEQLKIEAVSLLQPSGG